MFLFLVVLLPILSNSVSGVDIFQDDVSTTGSTVLRDMDDFLDEVMDDSSDEEQKPSPPKKV